VLRAKSSGLWAWSDENSEHFYVEKQIKGPEFFIFQLFLS